MPLRGNSRPISPTPATSAFLETFPFGSFIPDSIFNNTVPKLKCVKLCGFSVNWKSSLLKGLQTFQILRPPGSIEPPKLDDWLDGLGEMSQLESLTVYSATPAVPDGDQFISEPRRTVGLPFLTQFKISASAKVCALALAHLVLPALTSLHVAPQSHCGNGEDVRLLIPFVARYAHGQQDTAPLQSILFSSESWHTRILIWTVPDADVVARRDGHHTFQCHVDTPTPEFHFDSYHTEPYTAE